VEEAPPKLSRFVEGGRDEEVELGNRGQVSQRRWRLEGGILQDAAQAHIGLLASSP
jgi:hypothetical protein